jgi:anaerobic glycerol-3-phosphate dehydrogenase
MSLHSTSLQELCVDVENVSIDTVDLVAPKLKKLTVSLKAFREVNISILAPMLEKLSWKCSYSFINFGP